MPAWEVVGGADKGGIIVREGKGVGSATYGERLATGSIVEQLELVGDRLQYKLLKGSGPVEGWVSTKITGKDLLVPVPAAASAAGQPSAPQPSAPQPSAPQPGTSGSVWDFEVPKGEADAAGPPADAPPGSRWNPRYGEPPPPEAPYAKSIIDIQNEGIEAIGRLPKCIFTLKGKMKIKEWEAATTQIKPGVHFGIPFPHNFDLIREAGPSWLTKALHAAGTLPRDNSVVSLKVHELSTDSCAAESMGGQGMKGWLEVEYQKPHPNLHTELFVKLPFPFSPQNERVKNSFHSMPDEAEILINRILGPALPFKIPKFYFGEFSYETSNYILISEKLEYKTTSWAEGGRDMVIAPYEIEPRIVKFKDYEMPKDGLEQYAAAMRALGGMVAEYHKGGLGNKDCWAHLITDFELTNLMGIGRHKFNVMINSGTVMDTLAAEHGGSEEAVAASFQARNDNTLAVAETYASLAAEFVLNAPGIFPELAGNKEYLKQWFAEAAEVAYYAAEIKLYLGIDPHFTSLAHGNLAADNAWYWRNGEGVLEAGLLDFGGCGHRNIASNMMMSWLMAEPGMLAAHWTDLTKAFTDGVRDQGGPESITYEEMEVAVIIALAITSGNCGGNVPQLYKMMKKEEWAKIKDRWDPVVNDRFLPRNYTCALRTVILIWRDMQMYKRFQEWKTKNKRWFPPKKPLRPLNYPQSLQ